MAKVLRIGNRLRELRRLRRLTQHELAKDADLSRSAVVNIELGTRPDPTLSTLAALARALGVTVSDIVGDDPPRRRRATDRQAEQQPADATKTDTGETK